MVFFYDFAMLDNVDSNVWVYFSKNFNPVSQKKLVFLFHLR